MKNAKQKIAKKHSLASGLKKPSIASFKTRAMKLFAIFMLFCITAIAQPTITSVTPLVGYPGSTVSITGTNFNTTSGSNIVYFGPTQAIVTAATTTSLTVTVPTGAIYMPISVLNTGTGLSCSSQNSYLPDYNNTAYIPGILNYAPKVDFTSGTNPYSVAVGDLDGDGKPDLVVAEYGGNTVSVYRNTSSSGSLTSGSFASKVDFTVDNTPSCVVVKDLDGDGKPDIVVTNYNSNLVSILHNTATSGVINSASFATKVDFATSSNPQWVAVGDIDGDGKPDLAIANLNSNTISLLRNISTTGSITSSSFSARVDITTTTNPSCVAMSDLDGDGKLDLAVTNQGVSTMSVFRNISTKGAAFTSGSFATRADFTTGSNPFSVTIGDVDQDGMPDIVVANANSNTFSVFHNTAASGSLTTASFAAKVDFATTGNAKDISIGDIDGDGKPDIAVSNYGSTVSLFRNTGTSGTISSSSFAAKTDITTGSNCLGVQLADLDGDGMPDLVTTNYGANTISIIRNTGQLLPVTITSVSPSVGYPESSVTITGTNFNATAGNNIVYFGATQATVTAASSTSLTVTVPTGATYMPVSVLNTAIPSTGYSQYPYMPTYNGSAYDNSIFTFDTRADITAGGSPTSVIISDLDGDGKPDLALINSGSGGLEVYRNISSSGSLTAGSFASSVGFSTGSGNFFLTVGDLDGDGKPELVVTNTAASTVSVFHNTSTSGSITTSSFAARVDFATGSNPQSAAIGDLDGDGKPDIAVANFNSNTVSILRNTTVEGAITTSSFAAHVDLTTSTNPESVAIGDIDGDGKPDLVIANNGANSVSVLFNTAIAGTLTTSSFAAKVDFATGTNPFCVAIGDLDGDGKPDLAISNNGANTVSVLRNTATSGTITSSSLAAKVDFTTGTSPKGVAIGDMNGDGKPDLVVANASSGTVSIFRNTATTGAIDNTSFAAKSDVVSNGGAFNAAIGDLDGDGKPDLAFADNDLSIMRISPIAIPPTITGITPSVGYPSSSVTITGANFSATAANDVVYFGATQATVTAASSTSLTVTVPVGATYMPVSVINTAISASAYSQYPYLPEYNNSPYVPGAINLNQKSDATTGVSPYNVAIGDLDGDGKPDLAVSNVNSNTISVFRNISATGTLTAGSFAAKVDFTTGSNPRAVALVDLNGDGKLDIATTNQNSNTVSVFQNTATAGTISSASFASKVDFTTASTPMNLAASDIDGDGRPDLLVVCNANYLSVLHNNINNGTIGTSSFAAHIDFTTGGGPVNIAAGDLDGDGKPDIVVTNQGSNTVSVFRNTSGTIGNITYSSLATKVDFTTGSSPYSVAIGDLDGDGMPDLAVTNLSSTTVSVFRNTASSGSITSGSFAAKVDFTTGTSPYFVAIGDLDGDNKLDLVIANEGSNTISVLRNTATSGSITTSSFATKIDFPTGTAPEGIAIGDLDGDGIPDIAVCNTNATTLSLIKNVGLLYPPTITSVNPMIGYPASSVTITGANFNPVAADNIVYFGATQAVVTAATTNALTVTVPTGATYMPVSVLNTTAQQAAYSKYGFLSSYNNSIYIPGVLNFGTRVDFTTGSSPFDMAVADLDGDGKPDLAVVNYSSNTVSIYRNTSTTGSLVAGSFAAKVDFNTGSAPRGLTIGDVDGDGKPDIVVANYSGNTVSVLRNTATAGTIASSSFAAKVDFTTSTNPISVSINDIDGDGKPDLVVANSNASSISILRNTSAAGSITTASFASKVDFTTASSPWHVNTGDLDGDGKPEIVVANSGASSVSVFHNIATPGNITTSSLAAKTDFTTGASPYRVAIADIDGDGKPDLAVTNYNSSTVSVLQNTATLGAIDNTSFAAKVDFTAGTNPYGLAIGDIDGDGKPDMAVGNYGTNTVSVFKNTATPGSITTSTFAAKKDYTTTYTAIAIAIADLDGDDVPDLAFIENGSSYVSVIRNAPFVAPPSITSVSPMVGYPSSSVLITGTNFSSIAANNIVYFGATQATVNAATTTSLNVTVPTGATYAPVSVLNTTLALMTNSKYPFLPDYNNSAFVPGTVNLDSKTDFTTGGGTGPYNVAIGDLDGDGKPDLVVSNQYTTTMSVYRNISTAGSLSAGSFAAKVDFTVAAGTRCVAIGDLDGDGKPDIAIANYSASTISVFHNTSSAGVINSSSFAAKVDFNTYAEPVAVAIADIDGDGKPELINSNQGGAAVSVFHNNCTVGAITSTSFNSRTEYAVSGSTYALAVADLDGDGKPDIAVPGYGGVMSVLRNTSTTGTINSSTFAAHVDFTAGGNPFGIAIGDIDGDGKPDIAVANNSSNTISVFRNTATSGSITTASFAAKVDFTSGTSPYGLAMADIDGDGKLDILSANYGGTSFSVYRNTATSGSITSGSLAPKVSFTTGTNPSTLAVGDLDGDGLPDVVSANNTLSTISVFRNNPLQPIAGGTIACAGGTLSLSDVATGGTWSSGSTTIGTIGSSSGIVTGMSTGTTLVSYVLNGQVMTTIITVNPAPSISAGGGTTICNGFTTALTASGGTTYSWAPSSSLSVATGNSVTAGPSSTTTYTVTGTTAGCSGTATVMVSVNPLPTIGAGSGAAICAGSSTTLTATGGNTYSWSPSMSLSASSGVSVTASPTVQTTYTIVGTDVNGCSNVATTTVSVNPTPEVSTNGSGTICSGNTATLSGSGTLTYSWTGGITDGVPFIPPVGVNIYTVTGTNVYSCSSTAIATVTVNEYPSVPPITGNTVLSTVITTVLNDDMSGGVWASSSTAIASIDPSEGLVTPVTTGAVLISYTVTTSGCSTTVTTNVTVNTPYTGLNFDGIDDYVGVTNNSAFETNTGTIELWAQPDWTPGSRLGNPCLISMRSTTLSDTRYSFHILNDMSGLGLWNGTSFESISYTFTQGVWYHIALVYSASDCAVYINGVYVGNTGNGINTAATGNQLRIGMPDDDFFREAWVGDLDEVRIWNSTRSSSDIQSNMNCDISQQANLVAYYRFNGGTADGNNTAQPMTIDYSGNEYCGTLTNMALTGSTSNFVTGAVGSCNTISIPGPGTINGIPVICVNGTTALSNAVADGTWSSSNTGIATVDASGTVTGAAAGTAVITYILNCQVATTTVTVNALPTVGTTGGGIAICSGTTATLNGTGAVSYTWTAGITDGIAFTPPVGVQNYTVTGTDLNGCVNTASAAVTVNALPIVSTTGGGITICSGTTATLSGTGAVSYAWTGGIIDGTAFTPSLGIQSYTVTGTDANGCTNTAATTITVNASPTVGSTGGGIAICTGATATLSGTGAVSYSWTGGITDGTAFTPSTGVQSYTVSGTAGNGCVNTASTTITVNALPTVGSTGGGVVICSGTPATLSGSGAVSYTWTGDITNGIAFTPPIGVQSYTVTGTGANGCINTATATITVNAISAGTITGASSVNVGANITLTDTESGGTWSSSNTMDATVAGGVVSGTAVGTTTISYTMSNSCGTEYATKAVTINVTSIGSSPSLCSGGTTMLTDAVSGGTWSMGSLIATINGSTGVVTASNSYTGTATVTYTVGSSITTTVITVNPNPRPIQGSPTECPGNTITLTDATAGGTWSGAGAIISGTGTLGTLVAGGVAGTAIVSYTLPTGCYVTASNTIYPNPTAILGITSVCVGNTTMLSDATSGAITWSSSSSAIASASGGDITGISAGSATITYTINTGCFTTTTVNVIALPNITGNSGPICTGTSLALTAGSGTWSSSNNTIATVSSGGIVNAVSNGTTTIAFVAGTGCMATTIVTVGTASPILGSGPLCPGTTMTFSDASAGGSWSVTGDMTVNGSTGVVTAGAISGSGTLTYTLGSGCHVTTTVSVLSSPSPILGATTVCAGGTTTLTDATPGSGVSWTSSNTTLATVAGGNVTGVSAGLVTISYTIGSTGCTTTTTVSIINQPGITGNTGAICPASTLSLTAGTGSWSTSNAAIATVGTNGTVTGVSGGTATITFVPATGSGCMATTIITVSTTPAITGAATICLGGTTTLHDAVAGGTWNSGAPGIATVAATGVVTGVAIGTAAITYTTTTGCSGMLTVTVGSTSGAINGNLSLCEGTSTTLSDASAGGTWSMSSIYATVVGSTGVVTASASYTGTASISYTSGGCSATAILTVNPKPTPIQGSTAECAGVTVTLTNASAGGTWSGTGDATVTGTGTTGTLMAGGVSGTATVTYTMNTGCKTTVTNTIYSVQPITGNFNLCVGLVTDLSDASPVNSWSSSNTAIAIASGPDISGEGVGVATITFKSSAAGNCITTQTVTVNAMPVVTPINGSATISHAGSPVSISDATGGGIWTSSNTSVITLSGSTGSPINATALTTTGSSVITYAVTIAGCTTKVTKTFGASASSHGTGTTTVYAGSTVSVADDISGGIWSSSDNNIATVNSNGSITGIAPGNVIITHQMTGDDGVVSNSVTNVLVSAVPAIISVVPNPNKGIFTVRGTVGSVADEVVTLEVADLLGQVIYRNNVIAYGGKLNETITLNNALANGMYILNVQSATEARTFHFVIEQ